MGFDFITIYFRVYSKFTIFRSFFPQEKCGGRVSRQCDPRTAAGAFAGDEHRTHQFPPHQTRQHLVCGRHEAERERRHGFPVPQPNDRRHAVVLRQGVGGEHQEQLRAHLRTSGR